MVVISLKYLKLDDMIAYRQPDGTGADYTYDDAGNNRIEVQAGDKRTEHVINTQPELSQVLQSTATNGSKVETTYYFYGKGLIAQDTSATGYLTYHFNNVGSTMAVTDQMGKVKYSYNYSPYGELLEGEYSDTIPFLFNGQFGVTTDANGLYYMRARYYNVDIKRFINQDVLTGTLERISSLNRYSYVEGNPVSYLDPFGLEKSYNSKTSGWHECFTNIAYLLAWINIFFSNGAMYFSVGIGGVDIGLYIYDFSECDPLSDEAIEIWQNIAKDLVCLIPFIGDYVTVALFLKDKYEKGEL